MADKDVDGIVAAIAAAPSLRGGTVVCTALAAPRALPAEELAARWRALSEGITVRVEPDPGAALDLALASGAGVLVVAGSLYLVGAVRARLVDDPLLRDPEP
jgi:dihydrofolate synthase/folylpolyglutamate synthase